MILSQWHPINYQTANLSILKNQEEVEESISNPDSDNIKFEKKEVIRKLFRTKLIYD